MPSLCVALRDMNIGGVPRVYIDVLRGLAEQGWRTRIVSAGGELEPCAHRYGLDTVMVDWLQPLDVEAAVADFDAVLVVVDPALLYSIPVALATTGRLLLAVHSAAAGLAGWFSESGLIDLLQLSRAILEEGSGVLLTIGKRQIEEHARLFSIDPAVIKLLPPMVDIERFPFDSKPGSPSVLLAVARLSVEKRWVIDAGISLTAARLEADPSARFEVVGDGPWRHTAEALCSQRLPAGSYRFLGSDPDPARHMQRAGVLLATGITALEAMAVGRPVVLGRPLTADAHLPGPVVDSANFNDVRDASFNGAHFPGLTPEDVWERVDRQADREHLRNRVEREHTPASGARALSSAVRGLPTRRPSAAASVVARMAADAERRRQEAQSLANALWVEPEPVPLSGRLGSRIRQWLHSRPVERN